MEKFLNPAQDDHPSVPEHFARIVAAYHFVPVVKIRDTGTRYPHP